jgi:hypothetical protein
VSGARVAAARAACAALALGLGGACLPNPQSVAERRAEFPREGLMGALVFTAPPPGMVEVGAVFGERIKLVGYALDPEHPKRGDSVKVTFYWSALRPIAEDFQVFVHGDASGANARRIHGDHYPAKGDYPTDVWREGEIVADPFTIRISGDYAPERFGLYTGLYLGDYRLPLTDRGKAPADNENRSRAVEIVL